MDAGWSKGGDQTNGFVASGARPVALGVSGAYLEEPHQVHTRVSIKCRTTTYTGNPTYVAQHNGLIVEALHRPLAL